LKNPASGKPVSYARICLKVQFHLKKSMLTIKPASVNRLGEWFCLIDASICGAKNDADAQLTIFESSALKEQLF